MKREEFPKEFVFGAATAAYQIEGAKFGGAGPSHWDTFAAGPGNVVRGEDGATACDHYHRFDEDLDLIKNAHFDAYRFSTSWARVQPEGPGSVNAEGLDFYDRLVDGILARGLSPYLTLYHWDLPAAYADLGGWRNPDVHNWFGDFAEIIDDKIGDRVASIATINEPWCVAYLSHMLGHHAPGMRDIRAAARAMHQVLKAHGEVLARLRARGRENLGIVLNFEPSYPAKDTPEDRRAAAVQNAIYNRWFIEAISKGTYPAEALEGFAPHLPRGWEDDLKNLIHKPLDWLGVNYYTRSLAAHDPGCATWPAIALETGALPQTQMGWEIFPDGLSETLIRLQRDYVSDLPIYVTENGMAWDDHPAGNIIDDTVRQSYITSHLGAINAARAAGANVQGFFYWSLLDNYEWAFGYEKRFGLVHVDFETLQRRPKASYDMLKNMLAPPA